MQSAKEAKDEYKDKRSSRKSPANKASFSPHWDLHRLHIEFKSSKNLDAFDDETAEFEGVSDDSERTRVQIIAYAALVFKYQPRTFLFTVLIAGPYARLIRWDRAGAIVTNRFNYTTDPEPLYKFFRRFSRMNPTQQGEDESVVVADPDERREMLLAATKQLTHRDYARLFFKNSLHPTRKWWKIPVRVSKEEIKYFLVGIPRYCTGGLPGRGTRGYVALDLKPDDPKKSSSKFVWLKDVWRVDDDRIKQEGRILEELNLEKVERIPTLLCHSDVLDHSSGRSAYSINTDVLGDRDVPVQRTVTGDHAERLTLRASSFKSHIHYRMVVREVGRSLKSIENGLELAIVIYGCLLGASFLNLDRN